MSEDKRDDPLLNELDSLKGLLEAGQSDFDDSIDDLQMSTGGDEDPSDGQETLPEEFLRGWDDEPVEADNGPGTPNSGPHEKASSEEEDLLPEAYLVEIEKAIPDARRDSTPEAFGNPPPPEASSRREIPAADAEDAGPTIPTLEDSVSTGRSHAEAESRPAPSIPEPVGAEPSFATGGSGARGANGRTSTTSQRTTGSAAKAPRNEPKIPVLDEAVSAEDVRQRAPDALGATSWEELEAVVDLLLDRRIESMRETLKKELLGELERSGKLEPPE